MGRCFYEIYDQVEDTLIPIAQFGNMDNVPSGLKFFTKNEDFIQTATFRYNSGHVMRAHRHIDREPPKSFRTEEILLVWSGSVKCNIYNIDGSFRESIVLNRGDFVIVHNGGVGYEVLEENTIMMEVKSGPFTTSEEDRILL